MCLFGNALMPNLPVCAWAIMHAWVLWQAHAALHLSRIFWQGCAAVCPPHPPPQDTKAAGVFAAQQATLEEKAASVRKAAVQIEAKLVGWAMTGLMRCCVLPQPRPCLPARKGACSCCAAVYGMCCVGR